MMMQVVMDDECIDRQGGHFHILLLAAAADTVVVLYR